MSWASHARSIVGEAWVNEWVLIHPSIFHIVEYTIDEVLHTARGEQVRTRTTIRNGMEWNGLLFWWSITRIGCKYVLLQCCRWRTNDDDDDNNNNGVTTIQNCVSLSLSLTMITRYLYNVPFQWRLFLLLLLLWSSSLGTIYLQANRSFHTLLWVDINWKASCMLADGF